MENNILRQIRDIQVQADHIISNKLSLTEIENFAQYNDELKSFLIQNIDDEYIKKYIVEIPDLDLQNLETKNGLLDYFVGYLSGGLTSYYRQRKKRDVAIGMVRTIQGKYSSIEMLIKNYFE